MGPKVEIYASSRQLIGSDKHSLICKSYKDARLRVQQYPLEIHDLADWASESLQAAKLLYRQPGSKNLLKSGTKLDEGYYKLALPILRQQLARAGVRVAWMLNQIFR
jgi:hypothetical protein